MGNPYNIQEIENEVAQETKKEELRPFIPNQFVSHHIASDLDKYEVDDTKNINYIFARSGIYIKKNSFYGSIISNITPNMDIIGLPDIKETFQIKLPKIPYELFNHIILFFRKVYEKFQSEALLEIYFNKKTKEYKIFCPKQTATAAHVERNTDADNVHNFGSDFELVMDIHSHNVMGAFFSGTDDSDEQSFRLFGVVGNINKEIPDILTRVCNKDTKIEFNYTEIFDTTNKNFITPFPSDWLKQIEERKYTYGGNISSSRHQDFSGYGYVYDPKTGCYVQEEEEYESNFPWRKKETEKKHSKAINWDYKKTFHKQPSEHEKLNSKESQEKVSEIIDQLKDLSSGEIHKILKNVKRKLL